MKRLIKLLSLYLFLIIIPIIGFIIFSENTKNNYTNSFTASLIDKYEMLKKTNKQKIVFVGGSSLPFGLKSELIKDEIGCEVIDLGVYASLGTKAMMEISKANLNPGDIVVLAPELNSQTYSLYFNSDVMWEAVSDKKEIINLLSFNEKISMLFNYFDFSISKIKIAKDEGVSKDSLYSRTSFDEYGDIKFKRKSNIMSSGYDASQMITINDLYNKSFIKYVNEYIEELNSLSVDVYFSFSPINDKAISFTQEEENEFMNYLDENIECKLLGRVNLMTYESKYFYNTNYHLNDVGAVVHTINIIKELKRVMGILTPTNIQIPEFEIDEDNSPYDENSKYFNFVKIGNYWYISSVKDEYKNISSLVLPKGYNGHTIYGISAYSFDSCNNLEIITIPNNYRIYESDIFINCNNLKKIYLEIIDPGTTSVPIEGLFNGCSNELQVYILESEYTSFVSNYSWRVYRSLFTKYTK